MKGPLYQGLKKLKIVEAYSSGAWDEAGTLAHALEDILESFGKMAPMCRSLADADIDEDRATAILQEVREELAHVAYHLKDSKFLRVVADRHGMTTHSHS